MKKLNIAFKDADEEIKEVKEEVEIRKKIFGGTKGLKFDSRTHVYTLNGVTLKSGTQIIKRYVKPFEPLYISNFVANKNKQKGKKLTDSTTVRKYWRLKGERASTLGTSGHAFCEMYALDPTNTKPIHEIERNAEKLMKVLMTNFDIMETEQNRGNDEHKIGYTMDILLRHKKTRKLYIGDYKFSSNFTPEQYKKSKGRLPEYLLYPFRSMKLRDIPQDKGFIQLNLYKKLYEADTGLKIEGCLLFHIDGLNEENFYGDEGFKIYKVPLFPEYIDIILKPHKNITYDIIKKL